MKPKYSVMRIEIAKQRALMGHVFKVQETPERFEMDWTGEDEEELCNLISTWDEKTGHQGINEIINFHEFSGGRQYTNAGLSNLLAIHPGDGTVIYKDNYNSYASLK